MKWCERLAALGKRVLFVSLDRQVVFLPNQPARIKPSPRTIEGQQATLLVYDEVSEEIARAKGEP